MQHIKGAGWNFVLVVCLAVMLAACATAGKSFPEESVRDIRIGTTTKQDVLKTFGQPWRTGLEDGRETWTYGSYRYRAFRESVSSDLVIRFDQEGMVISYSYSTTNPKAGD